MLSQPASQAVLRLPCTARDTFTARSKQSEIFLRGSGRYIAQMMCLMNVCASMLPVGGFPKMLQATTSRQ
jgi:hypothetical protein